MSEKSKTRWRTGLAVVAMLAGTSLIAGCFHPHYYKHHGNHGRHGGWYGYDRHDDGRHWKKDRRHHRRHHRDHDRWDDDRRRRHR